MQERWPEVVVAQLVGAAARSIQPAAVVTFDARGVSGHANHVATHRGVLAWAQAQRTHCWLLVRACSCAARARESGADALL